MKYIKLSDIRGEKQHRILIPVRRETNKVSPLIILAFCLEAIFRLWEKHMKTEQSIGKLRGSSEFGGAETAGSSETGF